MWYIVTEMAIIHMVQEQAVQVVVLVNTLCLPEEGIQFFK